MNKALICGRLTSNPTVNTITNDLKVANFTVAVDRKRKGSEGQSSADFLRISCFGKQAEFAEQYLQQGDLVSIAGRIQTGSYNDKHGNKVYTTTIVSEELDLMRKHNNSQEAKTTTNIAQQDTSSKASCFMEFDNDEELPFN
jgi:single-strand DNA-binding protein